MRGKLIRWSLETDDTKIAARRRKEGKERAVADVHGDAKRTFVEVVASWAPWLEASVGPKTVQRYACSIGQWAAWLDGQALADVMRVRFLADVVRARRALGITNATIRRDLVALSSIANFAIGQGWLESNPVLPVMKSNKGMIADVVRAAIATGAREEELYTAHRTQVDHGRQQMTLIGKGRNGVPKPRVIDLKPFAGYETLRALPAYFGSPFLFWHGAGTDYKNFASQFAAIVKRTAAWAAANGVAFRSFRFHDLRHLHAINWLKDGRSIYDLQKRMGHVSIKTTEIYLQFLTADEELNVKGLKPATPAPAALHVIASGDTA